MNSGPAKILGAQAGDKKDTSDLLEAILVASA